MRVFFTAFVILLITSCQQEVEQKVDRFETLPENEAGDIVRKAIARAGGWENWIAKDNFSFYKKITHLDSIGAVERSVKQHHIYNLKNTFKARMEWNMGDDHYLIINNGEVAKKYKNKIELTDQRSKNEAWNSSYGSHYVIGMPYKLTDPGVTLTYEGIDSMTLDRPVHSIKVDYAKGSGSAGGMHRWWYYFDLDNYDLAGFFLDHGKGYSLTTYEIFEKVGAHRLHNKRFSYISNAKKEKVQLRTIYKNEEMQFTEVLDDNMFALE